MARIRMVTRTIVNSICTVKRANLNKAYIETVEINCGGGFTQDSDILKHIQKTMDTPTLKHLVLESVRTEEEIYGMPESEFLKYATKLDKR